MYDDINFKLHRQESFCVLGAWRGERLSGWSPLAFDQSCCPLREIEPCHTYGHPRRVDVASTVMVLALGAGCLGSAAVFQHDAALPRLVQPCCTIHYQIQALGHCH